VAWPDLLGVLRDCAGEVGEVCGGNRRHDQEASLKLSGAIRLGAMLKPQGFGDRSADADGITSCALGAAYDAAGIMDAHRVWDDLAVLFPILERFVGDVKCPVCDDLGEHDSAIPHLNDDHKWTREQIADWVETIEAQYEQHAKDELAARVEAGGVPI
jgi:hypothetical protein